MTLSLRHLYGQAKAEALDKKVLADLVEGHYSVGLDAVKLEQHGFPAA